MDYLKILAGVLIALIGSGIVVTQGVNAEDLMSSEKLGRASDSPTSVQSDALGKIPLTIGFSNLSGDDLAPLVTEDVSVISPLFKNVRLVPPHQIPGANILFVYVNLNDDGTIPGSKAGIRQIVQLTKADVLVVASPNSAEKIKKAFEIPGPKTASLIFTVNRNQNGFGRFFKELFEKMKAGKPMMNAWVELSPQGPGGGVSYAPATLFAAEGGNLAFPKAEMEAPH